MLRKTVTPRRRWARDARSETGGVSRYRGGWGDERGLALVEFALVVPLVFSLLFGVIEFGTVYGDKIALRQGVREGARQGAVANWGTSSSCSLHGATDASADVQKLMCLTKNRIGLMPSDLYVMVTFDTSYKVGQGLIVCAQAPIRSTTGLFDSFFSGTFHRTKVEMNIEVASGSETGGAEDVAGIGSTWSWCNAANPSP